MNLEELIKPDSVLCNVSARSKKHCLEILSELLTRSSPDIASEEVFTALTERERLGCTCVDKGVAFPHCRIAGLKKGAGALMKLAEPIEFDSPDGHPVDLVLGLMVPEELDSTDLADVENVVRMLRDNAFCGRLRDAGSSSELSDALFALKAETVPDLQHAAEG
jgi:PTS system nitrogen regulatory IIA component